MPKKIKAPSAHDGMRTNYDFNGGIRGKYSKKIQSSNVILLDPMLKKWFPTSESVNEALHALVNLAQRPPRKKAA